MAAELRAVCMYTACRVVYRDGDPMRVTHGVCNRCEAVVRAALRDRRDEIEAVRRDCATQVGQFIREAIQTEALRQSAA